MVNTNRINWSQTLEFIIIHLLAVIGLFYFSWTNLIISLILLWLIFGWGIAIGNHRLLSHRSFEPPKWFEYSLAVLASMAQQKGAIEWVTNHRIHHAFTEMSNDPHSPKNGFLRAYIGWMATGDGLSYSAEVCKKYSPDLCGDKFHSNFEKFHQVPTILLAVVLYLIGGLGLLAWGIGVRTVVGWHVTWCVNSIGHKFGPRRFKTGEDSTNNWILGILAFGDGFHNNHHAFPTSARHGFAWYEFDVNYIQLSLLEKLGIIKNVKTPTQSSIQKKLLI